MKDIKARDRPNRKAVLSFSIEIIFSAVQLIRRAFFDRDNWDNFSFEFAEFYSKLWGFAEHSISHRGLTLPTAIGDDPVHTVNRLLLQLYGGKFASLSMAGSSGALITLLTAVLPKLHKERDLILFDDMCHQSAIGGIIFGRWKAVRLPRSVDPLYKTVRPLTCVHIEKIIQTHGPNRIAAILLVTPTYDGFSSPNENRTIYTLAKSLGITVIIDGAWDSVRFRQPDAIAPPLTSLCDIWISSPHKRGLTPSSLGCMITHSETIAKLWDEAQDLGFRSSSPSFVEIMIAEHRLQQVVSGEWDTAFSKAEDSAEYLREYIPSLHPNLCVLTPKDVNAEFSEPAHILISTEKIPGFNSRSWANILSSEFGLDVEKATASTLLLLCASPAHFDQLEGIKMTLKNSFNLVLSQTGDLHVN